MPATRHWDLDCQGATPSRKFADRYRRFNRTGQTLSYAEVRQGLASLAPPVHMTNQEFMDVMHVVDPNQSGDISAAEWEAFLTVRAHKFDLHCHCAAQHRIVCSVRALYYV